MTQKDLVQPAIVAEDEKLPDFNEFALSVDDEPFELPECNFEEAIALLRLWREDESDTEEQEETFEFLRHALDEDRFTTRRLFP